MRFLLPSFVVGVLLVSHTAHAQIFNITEAESDTGGNTGSGAVIQGDASSRVEVRNTGSANGGSTEVKIEIETRENGETYKETLYERFEGRKGEVRFATTTRSGSDVRVRVGEAAASSSSTFSNVLRSFISTTPNSDTPTSSVRASIQAQIAADAENPQFFARLFAKFRAFWGF